MVKVFALVFTAAVACVAILGATTGAYSLGTPQQIGRALGAVITTMIVGLVFALVPRFRRGASRGAISGVVAVVVFSTLSYIGISH